MQGHSSVKKIFLLCVALMLPACQVPTTYGPKVTDDELRAETEYENTIKGAIMAQGGQPELWRRKKGLQDSFDRVAGRIEKAGAELCREMGMPKIGRKCYYYFYFASRTRDLNAYSNGKDIIVTQGMMRFLKDDNELGIVMAHEFAHNLMGHHQAEINNAMLGRMMGEILDTAARSQGGVGGGMADAGTELGAISYSIPFEREADYVGAYIASRAGYDVRQATNVWRRMSNQDPDFSDGGLTHPANPERFVALNKTVTEIEYKRKHHLPLIPNAQPQTQQ